MSYNINKYCECIHKCEVNIVERFAIYFIHGKRWNSNQSLWDQGVRAHKEYWGRYLDEGKVIAGGPYIDHTDDFVILDAENEEEVQKLVENDPAIIDQKYTVTIRPIEFSPHHF